MSSVCTHLACLDRELEMLVDLECALWQRATGEPVAYRALMAKLQRWLVSQP